MRIQKRHSRGEKVALATFSSEGKDVSVLSEQTHKGTEFGGRFPP